MTSPGRRKASIDGQRKDWVRCFASLSRGVRGGGSWFFATWCAGVEGRDAVRAARRDLIEVLEYVFPLTCGDVVLLVFISNAL